jgi:hypothetical protein
MSPKAEQDKRLAKPGMTVELVQGEQWVDELSGVSLFRGKYRMALDAEMKASKDVAQKGYVKLEEEKKPFDTIPKGKNEKDLVRVEKALRLGILKIYDPENPTIYKEKKNADEFTEIVYDDRILQLP